jgi:arginine/ornithine transport system substrate-binding protein
MKKLLLTAIITTLMVSGVQAKPWKQVRVAIEGAYPPFSSVDEKGELHGFDVDMTNALCEQMKVKCTIVKQDWDGMIPGLLARKFDAIISTMDITEERKKSIDFSEKYQHVPAHFAAKKGATIELTQAFMKDKKIAVQRATSMDTYVSDNFPDATIKRYGSYDDAYLDLKSGRVDYVLADTASAMDGLVNKSNGEYSLVGPGLSDKKWFGEGAGVALRKGDGDLKAMFSKAILDIRANGNYKKINDKYFDFDVYGE